MLAEILRNELCTDYSDAVLWSEEGRLQPAETIIKILETAPNQYDFAIIILAKADIMIGGAGKTLRARDNCLFEAGLFMSSIGRQRCFLVNSVNQDDLPSDLQGIISIQFDEPADPNDLNGYSACAQALANAGPKLKAVIKREGPAKYHRRLPLLSVDEVFRRERPRADGGDLDGGQVLVVDAQPWAEIERIERVAQIRRNIDNRTRYHYVFAFSDDTVEKICQALQMITWAGLNHAGGASDFRSRRDAISSSRNQVLADLRQLCRSGLLRFSLTADEPVICFRLHNAGEPTRAQHGEDLELVSPELGWTAAELSAWRDAFQRARRR